MTLPEFKDALGGLGIPVRHYHAFKDEGAHYLVWQETAGRAQYGDDGRREVIRQIQVELYTVLDDLLALLEEQGVAFAEPVTSYDEDTDKIRHIVECEVA